MFNEELSALIEHNGIDCVDVADVIALEQHLAATGTPLAELMDRAGAALAEAVLQCALDDDGRIKPTDDPCNVLIFAGSGNNGGDGWVAARMLGAREDMHVMLVTPVPACDIKAEPAHSAAVACEELIQSGAASIEVLVRPEQDEVTARLADANIAVDALLGTGFNHEDVREPMRTWIESVNAERQTRLQEPQGAESTQAPQGRLLVIAADCPSGLHAQTGTAAATAVTADVTVTMLAAKTGMLAPEAAPYVGKLFVASLL